MARSVWAQAGFGWFSDAGGGRAATPWRDSPNPWRESDEAKLPNLLGAQETTDQIYDRLCSRKTVAARTLPPIAAFCLEQIRLAYRDLTSTCPEARENRDPAREWIARDYDHDDECADVASFHGCCETVGIEPTSLRAFLLALPMPSVRKRGPIVRRRPVTIQPVLLPRRRGRPPRILVACAA